MPEYTDELRLIADILKKGVDSLSPADSAQAKDIYEANRDVDTENFDWMAENPRPSSIEIYGPFNLELAIPFWFPQVPRVDWINPHRHDYVHEGLMRFTNQVYSSIVQHPMGVGGRIQAIHEATASQTQVVARNCTLVINGYFDDNSGGTLVSDGVANGWYENLSDDVLIHIDLDSGNIFDDRGGGHLRGTLPTGPIRQIAFTIDGASRKLFCDGVEVLAWSYDDNNTNNRSLRIGDPKPITGAILESIYLFSDPLIAAQIPSSPTAFFEIPQE